MGFMNFYKQKKQESKIPDLSQPKDTPSEFSSEPADKQSDFPKFEEPMPNFEPKKIPEPTEIKEPPKISQKATQKLPDIKESKEKLDVLPEIKMPEFPDFDTKPREPEDFSLPKIEKQQDTKVAKSPENPDVIIDYKPPKPPSYFSNIDNVEKDVLREERIKNLSPGLDTDQLNIVSKAPERIIEELERPCFVEENNYKDMVDKLNLAKKMANEITTNIKSLNEIGEKEKKMFERWHNNLEDFQRKLVLLDKKIFEQSEA